MSGAAHRKPGSVRQWYAALFYCLLFAFAGPLQADSPTTGVLYPDIREPFRSVFLSIARGVSDELGKDASLRAISDEDSAEDIRTWVERNGIRSLIALGSRGRHLSDELGETVPVILGAVHMSPDLEETRYYGIALSPDPALLLQRLKTLAPAVRRVTVVYHRERDNWMIERARRATERMGIELNAVPVDKLQEAAGAYRTVLGAQASSTEALWLTQDSAVLDEQAVLPMILREAWDRKLIVFSTNPSHVRRGILFALYPDNYRMGRSLGEMAALAHRQQARRNQAPRGMELLQDLSMAFNVRTAGHLGIRYTREFLNEAELVFPLM